ncbi:MAG: hypothetical protein Kow0013_27840 [Pararhodobacter sp.]
MKLRAVTLSDVRQFTRPVRVEGITDGLNVLSAPNEAGKSTLFDAIHAVFFIAHTSRRIAPLRPAAGGTPEITLDLEHEGRLYRVHKRWGRGAMAEVWEGARAIAKGDAAEDWLAALIGAPDDGGPAGLLWVRQGLVALDDGTSKEQKDAQTARRDLISSVTGEFEALTGGKRMDRALARTQEDLARLVTQRGAKAGGPLDSAQRDVARLEARHALLTGRARALREALDTRRQLRRSLAELNDPAEIQRRQERLHAARAAQAEAARHAEALATAEARAEAARLTLAQAEAEADRRTRAERALHDAQRAAALAARDAETAARSAREAAAAQAAAQARAQDAHDAQRTAERRWHEALRVREIRAAQARRAAMAQALSEAQTLLASLPALREAARKGPDEGTLAAITRAAEDLRLARAVAEATAPRLGIRYDTPDAPRVQLEGVPLAPGDRPAITRPTTLTIPGIGTMTVTPGEASKDHADLARAEAKLADLCAASGVASPDAARDAAIRRSEAAQRLQALQTELKRLAPEGVDALKQALDALPQDAPATDDPDDPEQCRDQAEAARHAAETARAIAEAARTRAEDARTSALRAGHAAETAARIQAERAEALAALPAEADLAATAAAARAEHARLATERDRLRGEAPDLALCAAALHRAEAVATRAAEDIARLQTELARLDTLIDTESGAGVDEDLADTALELDTARDTLAAVEHEVAVLRALAEALDTARAAARDRYFAPLLTELRPLLGLLWPGAELRFDGDSLLPDALIRDGQEEPIGTLSGGTREQIALLVRLAFARLLARSGRHAPVILDDALVYTDDDRIEQMFTALTAQAGDLQIIVLGCRNRALRALGGTQLAFAPA